MSFHPQTQVKAAIDGGDSRRRAKTRRVRRPRWGLVNCPDGPHSIDLAVMRRALTQMLVARELSDDTAQDLARKAGISRSTVSRIFVGRGAGLKSLLTVLAVLGLTFEDVVSDATTPNEEPSQA